MPGRIEKCQKLHSKINERILKVTLKKYKPILMRKPKPADQTEDSSVSNSDSDTPVQIKPKEYSNNPIKVDNVSLEKRLREETVTKLMGNNYPHLAQLYTSGEITLAQLKQHFYSLSKKIDYTCYDELKKSLNINESAQGKYSRHCYSVQKRNREESKRRPQSASWNFDSKIRRKYESSSITSEIFNNEPEKFNPEANLWNPSIKVDSNLISEPYRRVCITNDRQERPKSSLIHGGRLSAKAMHDMMVESIFPFKKTPDSKKSIDSNVKKAVKTAAERIKNYSEFSYRRTHSALMKRSTRRTRANSEVRDIIYL